MANFADLLKKIANNSRLTPQELDELGRFGTEMQLNNAFTSSIQNGTGSIKASSITANTAFIQNFSSVNNSAAEKSVTLTATQSMPNNSFAGMYGYSEITNDGYSYSGGGGITVPENGLYAVSAYYQFDDSAASTGTRQGYVWTGSSYTNFSVTKLPVSGTNTNFILSGQINLFAGNSFSLVVYQNSGGSMNVTLRVTVRKVG